LQRPCETQIIVTRGFALTFVVATWIRMPSEACGQDGYWRNQAVVSLADTSHLH
jgi:probable phosphoglycerate mutase